MLNRREILVGVVAWVVSTTFGIPSPFAMFGRTFWMLALLLLIAILYNYRAQTIPGIPNPGHEPFIGAARLVGKNYHRLYDYFVDLGKANNWKPITISLPFNQSFLLVYSPENIEYILKTNFNNFIKGQLFADTFGELFGDGIFATDGDQWRHQRKVASHMFSMKIMKTDMVDKVLQHGARFVEILDKAVESKQVIDLQAYFYRCTMDAINDIAFGVDLCTLQKDKVPFADAFDRVQEHTVRRLWNPFWKFRKMLQTDDEVAFAADIKILDDFAYDWISSRDKHTNDDLRSFPDLLSQFLADARETGQTMTPKELRDVLLNFMIAGRDTTASLLSWMFYEFSLHPEYTDKVLEEIKEKIPESGPTYETSKSLTFLEACIYETLRTHSPVLTDMKVAVQDDHLPDGSFVPKGFTVMYPLYSIGHSEANWGKDAHVFRPERWLTEKDNTTCIQSVTPFQFPAFNAGPRLCLGKHVAIMEAQIITCLVLPKFQFVVAPNHKADYRVTIVSQLIDGLKVNVSYRK